MGDNLKELEGDLPIKVHPFNSLEFEDILYIFLVNL